MSRIVVFNSVTLGGVMQAPARPDEDPRGGFQHGGWAVPYSDAVIGSFAGESMATGGGLLFGRRTYEDLYSVWPKRTDNPYTEILNNSPKYVVSTTMKEPLPWQNSTLLKGEAADSVAKLKQQPGKDLVILGSGQLIQTLVRHNLIDEYFLLIHPLILGSGRRLFADGGALSKLRLISSKATPKGVLLTRYQPA